MLRDEGTAFDQWVDRRVERWRGQPLVDGVSTVASTIGDHGLVWFLLGLRRARRPGPHRGPAIWSVVFSGAVIPLLNSTLKSTVQRVRPERNEREVVPVRIPRTASFPSGHTLAAWCAATVLSEGDPMAPMYYALAGVISYSRVHVRLHHATDVVGGAALGIGLGLVGRYLRPFATR